MTFVEVALCDSDAHGQDGPIVELTAASPARWVSDSLFVDHMMLLERRSQMARDKEAGDE